MAFKEGRDAMSLRKPPGAIDGKAVVLAFFAATVYFSFTFSKSSSSNSRGSASSSSSSKSSSGKKTSTAKQMMRKRDGTCRATDDDDMENKRENA